MQKTNKSTRDKKLNQAESGYINDFYKVIAVYVGKGVKEFKLQNCFDILTNLQQLSAKLTADLKKLDE